MLAEKNFLTFITITDPDRHHAYNEWHHLDHRPETLSLPHVLWGERWVRTPDCREVSRWADERFADFHYMNLYWLRGPGAEAFEEFHAFGARSFQWGRRPELAFVERPFVAVCDPVKGYVNDSVLVSTDVLPWRPNLGVYVTVARYGGETADVHEAFRWWDRVAMPSMLACPGAAGGWTLVQEGHNVRRRSAQPESPMVRVSVVFLERDPVDYATELAECAPQLSDGEAIHAAAQSVLFSGPLRLIQPFDYSWFDQQEGS